MSAPLPNNEYHRLLELSDLDLDYSSLQEHLEDLTKLAARIAGTKISLVNVIDSYTQWSVANQGLEIKQMPRDDSVCQYVIPQDEPLEIKDLSLDDRFSDKFYVTGDPQLRYYYGVPLKTSNGSNIGALCVVDTKTLEISPEGQELLQMVGNQVIRHLEALTTIKTLQDKVQDLNQSRRKVSHDIRNPIAGIIGIAQIMKEEIKSKRVQEILELADLIQKSGESLLELTDGIMSEEEIQQPGANEFSCETFTEKLKELYMPQARTKGIRLEFKLAEQSGNVFFSKTRLLQIVGNLLSNSLKFTPEQGRVSVLIQVDPPSEENEANTLRVEIEDTGTGMSQSKIDKILKGDTQSEKGSSGERGYGFGLPLVLHLVEKAKGEVDVQSTEGHGTRFSVKLPV